MAIKVNIPSGQNTATVSGLYQWDYGQVLEIESADLGNMIGEVHFACSSMSEAVVVSCNFTEGLGSVTIPDECLEQSFNITAWIYEISGTQGRTRKVITIYVTARTRPSVGQDIPTEISNRYTELITEVNEAINALKNGDVVTKKATEAVTASTAASAGNASTANHAISAGEADSATYARYARTTDGDIDFGHFIHTYEGQGFQTVPTKTNGKTPMLGGVIIFRVESKVEECSFVMELPQKVQKFYSPLFTVRFTEKTSGSDTVFLARLRFDYNVLGGGYTVTLEVQTGSRWDEYTLVTIDEDEAKEVYVSYKHIGRQYPYIPY